MKIVHVVACCLVDKDGRVLLATRPSGKVMEGYYEFPGGKIEALETPEQALVRELKEEIGIETQTSCLAPFSFISYRWNEEKHIVVLLYICRKWQGFIESKEGQSFKWVKPRQLSDVNMLPANASFIAPLIDLLG